MEHPALHRRLLLSLAFFLAFAPGLGRRSVAKPIDVAVLPSSAVNIDAGENGRLIALLTKRLRAHATLRLNRTVKEVAELAKSLNAKCHEENTCLHELGRKLEVTRLLLFRSGRLGETLILRLALFNVETSTRQGNWQEVLNSPSPPQVERSLDKLIAAFAPRPLPPPRPWYRHWWVWTAVTGVVVAGSVTAILLSTQTGPSPGVVITPPSP